MATSGPKPSETAPELPRELIQEGFGPDAWRFLRRLGEPGTYMRAARDQGGRVEVFKINPNATRRPLLTAPAASALDWWRRGWVAPVARIPSATFYALTPLGRRAEREMRPNLEIGPRHPGVDAPERCGGARRRATADARALERRSGRRVEAKPRRSMLIAEAATRVARKASA